MIKALWNNTYLLMIFTALAWSGNSITARSVNDIIPPIGLAFWRWVIAIPILLILAWPHLRRDLPLIKHHWMILTILSALSISIYNTFLYQALLTTTAINGFLINTSRPAIIVVLSILFFSRGISRLQAVGFALAMVGTVIIIAQGDITRLQNLHFNSGDLWVISATLAWAFYTVLLPKSPKMHPTSFLVITVFLGMLLIFPFYIWEAVYIKPTPFRIETVGSVLYLAIVSSIIAYLCYNRAVELSGPTIAGQVSYMLPIIGTLLAIVLLGEELELFHAIGMPLILCGVYLGSRKKQVGP